MVLLSEAMSPAIAIRTDVRSQVETLAQLHGITDFEVTSANVLAADFTRLSDNDVPQLDDTQLLIMALKRAGHLNKFEAMDLQASYLSQKHD